MVTMSYILITIQKFNHRYAALMQKEAKRVGLSKIELDILLFLRNNPSFDTAKDIVEYRGIAKSYVSKTLDQLKEQGLIALEEDPHDRRLQHIRLTDKSAPIAEDAKQLQEKFYKHLLKGIPEHSILEMKDMFFKIHNNINDKEDF